MAASRLVRQTGYQMQWKRSVVMVVILAFLATLSCVSVSVLGAPRAVSAPGLPCGPVYSLQGDGDHNLWEVDKNTGAQTSVAKFATGKSDPLNALGVYAPPGSTEGTYAIALSLASDGSRQVWKYDTASGKSSNIGAGVKGALGTHGAINPATGNYYYGGISNGVLNVYGFDIANGTSMGLVAQGKIPTGNNGGNGDFAFDTQGNLHVVGGASGSNILSVVDQQIPNTGGQTVAITATQLAVVTTPANEALNGLAFNGQGYLNLASTASMLTVNPSTGAVVGSVPLNSKNSYDLASCASPSTITLLKDFPDGRHSSGDQVDLAITGGGISRGNTGTTSGNASGVQDQDAGPVIGLPGTEYTITESGKGTGEPNYASAWQCVNSASGDVIASGDGSSGVFTMPDGGALGSAIICTFTNKVNRPGISLEKTADKSELVAGETVTYSFKVTNTGNVALNDVKVNEGDFTGSGKLSAVSCPDDAKSLAPGDSVTCTATYQVTQADVDRGSIENSATATGTPPNGGDPVTSDPASAKVPADQKPGINIVKSADKSELVAGETVTYSFVVTNTGNVTLTDVKVNEGDFTGSGKLSAVSCPDDAKSLAPGAQVTCTATYQVTQADVDRGSVENSATATGTPPNGGDPVTSEPSSTHVPADQKPGISIEKSADKSELVAGQTITYSFKVTNTGNVTLSDVKVNEGDFTGSGQLSAITCPDDAKSLAPGAQVTCTATYQVTQADVDRGSIENSATATGTPPNGGDPVTSAPSSVTVKATPTPEQPTPTPPIQPAGHLPDTGMGIGVGMITLAALILIFGSLITLIARRRRG